MYYSLAIITTAISGLYTSLWGAFKDSPYEGFKPKTFPRSIYFNLAIFVILMVIPFFRTIVTELSFFQLFFLVMGIERVFSEFYKSFFRYEDQAKYFVPSRFTLLGKPVHSELIRHAVGVLLTIGIFSIIFLTASIESWWGFLLTGYCSGLVVSFGGAYKDAPFEGFDLWKFQRSSLVLAFASPIFYFLGAVPLGVLIFMFGGLERFFVEYYKTYIQRNMSGKFKPDLKKDMHQMATREKFHYGALIIIAALVLLYVSELSGL